MENKAGRKSRKVMLVNGLQVMSVSSIYLAVFSVIKYISFIMGKYIISCVHYWILKKSI